MTANAEAPVHVSLAITFLLRMSQEPAWSQMLANQSQPSQERLALHGCPRKPHGSLLLSVLLRALAMTPATELQSYSCLLLGCR